VSSLSLVRYKTNDYSVPVAYGHREVWIRGYVDQVVIGCAGDVIARHPRSYDREDMIFDPIHYLALLEQKIGAFDQAAPLANWDLPEAFQTLRRLMEARMLKAGRREYVQVLRLLESFDLGDLHVAVKTALRMGAIGFDAVKHLVLCQVETRPPKLGMTDAPRVLLNHHLKTLKLPTFLREYDKLARQCAAEGLDHVRFLARLVELEMIDRERRMIERRIKAAKFPATKSLDSFDFKAIPTLNKMQVLELARCEWIERRENAAALVHELMEARDERRLLRLQKQLVNHKLLIIDELGFVPLSKTGAELLFELISQRYERGATLITSNLPFEEWTETFGSERLTGALLDRLTHHVSILEMNGDSYRLSQSRARKAKAEG